MTSSPKVEGLADDTTETATDGSADAGTDQPSATKGMHRHPMRDTHEVRRCFRAQDNSHSSRRYHLIQFAVYDGNRVPLGFGGCATRPAGVLTCGHDDADQRGRQARDLRRVHFILHSPDVSERVHANPTCGTETRGEEVRW